MHNHQLLVLFLLIFGHFMGDFPLQNTYMALGKNHANQVPGTPWRWVLTAHAFIHGGIVALIFHSFGLSNEYCLAFGVLETFVHWIIDDFKSGHAGISYTVDQTLHIACKVAYFLALIEVLK